MSSGAKPGWPVAPAREQLELDDVAVGIEAHHGAGDAEVGGEHDACACGEEVERGDEVGGIVDLPADVGHPHLVRRVGSGDVGVLVQGEVAVAVRARQAQERELVVDVLGDHLGTEELGVELDRALPIGDVEGDVVERDGDHVGVLIGERRRVRRSMPTMRRLTWLASIPQRWGPVTPQKGGMVARAGRLRGWRCVE